jgi:hypothetical protein
MSNSYSGLSDTINTASSSIAHSLAARDSTRPTSVEGDHSQCSYDEGAYGEAYRGHSPELPAPSTHTAQLSGDMSSRVLTGSIGQRAPEKGQAPPADHPDQEKESSKRKKLKKELRKKTLEAQVLKFRAWEKPHRTDEHITPGVYRGFWIWLARCLTFYIPSWFLKKYLGMDGLRQRLAFRQKVLFCLLLAAIYAVICYFLVIQPIVSCVVKVPIGMIPKDSPFCTVVRTVIYVYMGLGAAFMLLVAICVTRVRYTNRSFEEHDALLVMQIPCYNEDEATLRKTIESCVQSSYEKKRKLLFIVADGTVAAKGQKPTYRILLEDIFDHSADLELGLDTQAQEYESFDENGASKNRAYCCTGHYRGVPYVVVIKVGREDEQNNSKPGNRGNRSSSRITSSTTSTTADSGTLSSKT